MDVFLDKSSVSSTGADTLVLLMAADSANTPLDTLNAALNGMIAEVRESGDFTGNPGETTTLYPRGVIPARRVILVGVGDSLTVDALRRAAATGLQRARALNAEAVALGLSAGNLGAELVAQAVTEGALMGLYRYHGQKSSDAPVDTVKSLAILGDNDAMQAGLDRGKAFAGGAILARHLVNLPPNICTPAYLAKRATEMANAHGLKIEVLEEGQMRALKMGALLAVAQGSHERPRFIILEHNAGTDYPTVVLVGKGVTFDTGGYSLKTGEGMIGMKADMGGGAAVIGAMQIVAELDLPLHVVGLVPTSDNNISEKAYRPQEVITASNGKTIEIISTDAEGRMLLADGLVYAGRYKPAAVVDIATLTGACVVALGHAAAGLFFTDDALRDALVASGEMTGERVWPMPLFPEYQAELKSHTADMLNTPTAKNQGVGTSATFLRNFVDYPAWAHVDMAGMMLDAKDNPTIPEAGGTGYGARLLAQFVERWSQKKAE